MQSLYQTLLQEYGEQLAPQVQRKATLTVLSHALEDAVIEQKLAPVMFTAFQDARYYQREKKRYDLLNTTTRALVVYGKGLEMSPYTLEQDWFVVVNEPRFKAMLVSEQIDAALVAPGTEVYKPFNVIWSYDATLVDHASRLLAERTLGQDNPAQGQLSAVLAQPHEPIGQAQLVQHVGHRILAELELTNLRVMRQIMRNQQLLSNLEQHQEELGLMSRERVTLTNQQDKLQYELMQLYAEFNRTQNLMTETFLERARLEQQRALSSSLLEQLRQVVSEMENDKNPSLQVDRVAELVKKLTSVYQAR